MNTFLKNDKKSLYILRIAVVKRLSVSIWNSIDNGYLKYLTPSPSGVKLKTANYTKTIWF